MKRFALALALIAVAACGPSANPTIAPSPGCITTPPPSDAPTPHCAVATPPLASPSGSAPAPSASPFAGAPTKVRLALDWTPNTDHTGFFVARHNGWYREAGIDLQVLPYGTIAPEQLMAGHQAECGISFQDSLTYAVAGGADLVSVAAILQRTASAVGVLADSPIQRPRDLDGKTYGSFGYPNEVPTLKFIIKADGGKGDVKVATLDTAAYEALYHHQVDATIPFTAWEGVEAKLRGIDLRYFAFTDYGFPDFYQVVLACDRAWLTREPDAARRFVGATARGFTVAATDPDAAAATLVSENPGVFDANPALPKASQQYLATGGYLLDEAGRFGTQTLARWTGYSSFLADQGLLVDSAGKPLPKPLDYARLFTNDYLP